MTSKYNTVRVYDFDFFETLGKGSFGIVMRCRKKTTKKFYAMKIISKHDLLHACRHDLSMVDMEIRALAAIRHPFIVGMDYSFQNSHYAFIVMEIAMGGTLATVLQSYRKRLLKESHIRFYVAEIVEALHYLHGVGLVYQDLKLSNVLIDMDGHVKLADLGGVADPSGEVICSKRSERLSDAWSPLSSPIDTSATITYKAEHLRSPIRHRNVYGTRGYMAPEVLELLTADYASCKGSAYMADWWSLGILTYVLLTGQRPFDIPKGCPPEQELETVRAGQLSFPEFASPESIEFICSLLELDDTKRLGYGIDGMNDIMRHPFFESYNWPLVIKKKTKPPLVPADEDDRYDPYRVEAPLYDGYDCLPMIDKDLKALTTEQQKLFSKWYVIFCISLDHL